MQKCSSRFPSVLSFKYIFIYILLVVVKYYMKGCFFFMSTYNNNHQKEKTKKLIWFEMLIHNFFKLFLVETKFVICSVQNTSLIYSSLTQYKITICK